LLSAGGEVHVRDQTDQWERFAVIKYIHDEGNFTYSARHYHIKASSYICQLQQQGMFEPYWI